LPLQAALARYVSDRNSSRRSNDSIAYQWAVENPKGKAAALTTKRQVRSLLEPLVERHTDFVLLDKVGNAQILALRPVHHLLRFIFVDRTGNADVFNPKLAFMDLFRSADSLRLQLSELLYPYGPYRRGLWSWADPNVSRIFAEMVERDALPKLRSLTTLQDYLDRLLPKDTADWKFYRNTRVVFGIALGDLDLARDLLPEVNHPPFIRALNEQRAGLADRLVQQGARLNQDDRRALAQLLHRWERESVQKLNLAAVWEPTAFPLELETAGD
jgi:hypothetical protein